MRHRLLAFLDDRLVRFLTPGHPWSLSPVWRYGLAVLIVVVATALRWALIPWLGTIAPYNAALVAVVVTTLLLGIGPGLLCVLLADVAAEVFITRALPRAFDGAAVLRLGISVAIGVFVAGILHAIRVAQIKARESEVRSAAFAAATFEGIGESHAGRIVDCNEQLAQILGYTAAELKGMTIAELTAPEDLERVLVNIRENRESVIEHAMLRKDGAPIVVEAHGRTVDYQGRKVRFTGVRDVTERKRAAEALRESEERLRLAQESARVGTFEWDFQTNQIRWTHQLEMLYGLPLGGFDGSYEGWRKLVHPEDSAGAERSLREGMRSGRAEHDFRVIWPDGTVRWLAGRGHILKDDSGQVVRMIGVNIDITESKRAELKLKDALVEVNRFREAMERVSAYIYMKDLQSRYIYANKPTLELFGCSAEELPGRDDTSFFPPETVRRLRAVDSRVFAGEQTSEEIDVADGGSGRRVYLEVKTPIYAEPECKTICGLLGISTDITDRKRAEEALRRSETQFRDLADAMPQMVWITGRDGYHEHFNRQWYEYTGASFEETAGDGWLKWLDPDDQQRAMDRWDYSMRTGEPFEIEYRFRRGSDGAYRWFLGRGLAVRDEQDNIVRWFGTCTDIHEQKQLQEQLVAAQLSAEQARSAAEHASRAKDHFLAVLSHELRTPLTPVLAIVSLLQAEDGLNADTRESFEMIRRNIELEARLIDDLLDMTRIARGKVELNKKQVELCDVIRRAVEVCKPDIEARRLGFGVDIGIDAPYLIEADPARLQQVFWNLLKNAIKFTPHEGWVGIRCHQVDGHVIVEVNDSGEGIDPEALGRIFNAFEQAERSITRQFGGLGLGLAISKALVEMHGGAIEAHSDGKGKGATFRVRLPLHDRAELRPPSPAPKPDSALSNQRSALRILLVEDHGDTAKVMARLLKRRGYEVQTAGDVATALEIAGRQSFDLLISDLGLPDRSGVELIRELRAGGHKLPAIALSGYGQEEDVIRSREAGFDAHLTKPVDFEQFYSTIAAAVR